MSFYSEYLAEIRSCGESMYQRLPKFRPEVAFAVLGFLIGMMASMGVTETVDSGVFVITKAAEATAWTANWFVEPKYTGQEDLPPGFRGEQPSLETRRKDESQPMECQTVDPSALVCSTVRVTGFDTFNEDKEIFVRRAFDEIQGRAPFVSESGKYLAYWCEKAAAWRLTNAEEEQLVRDGHCRAFAASDEGIQFKDSRNWVESVHGTRDFQKNQRMPGLGSPQYAFAIQVGEDSADDDSWVPATDVTCR